MASRFFNTRILENLRTEAEWLADTSYYIIPRETVMAISKKSVTVNGTPQDAYYIRTKVNDTDTNRLFSELKYTDEYVELKLDELGNIRTEFNDLSTTVTQMQTDIQTLQDDVGDLSTNDEIIAIKKDISDLSGTVATVSTDVGVLTDDVGTLTTSVTNMTSDINTLDDNITDLTSTVNGLSGTVSTLNVDIAGKADLAGATFTGTVELPAISGTPTDTQAVTVKYMKDYIDANPAGTQVVLSATTPVGLPNGSIWLKEV